MRSKVSGGICYINRLQWDLDGELQTDVESSAEYDGCLEGAAGFSLLDSDFFCGGGCCIEA